MKIITNSASALGILGAILIALNINQALIGYLFFIVSSILWAVFAYKTQNRQLLIMNVVFISINSVGIYNFS